MKFIFYFTLILFCIQCRNKDISTLSKIRGKWINQQNDFIEINDTASYSFILNYLHLYGKGDDKYLEIKNDTLSFQKRYYSSETNFTKLHIEPFDFLLKSISDSFMILSPISFLSKDDVKLIRQEYNIDKAINFEKIIFHTTTCYGSCPVYHLEVDNKKKCKLHKELVFKEGRNRPYTPDSTKIGYFYGEVSDQLFEDLIKAIKTSNLTNLEFEDIQCCDGTIFTLIIYYNNRVKYLKSMVPPRISVNLINKLIEICENSLLYESSEKFVLDK